MPASAASSLANRSRRGALRAFAVPVLDVAGADTPVVNASRACARLEALVPDVDAVVIPDAGHALGVEHPTTVNALVIDVLHRVEAR